MISKKMVIILLIVSLLASICRTSADNVNSKIFFVEKFDTDPLSGRWLKSTDTKYASQSLKWSASSSAAEGFDNDKGLLIAEELKHYGIATQFPKPLSMNDEKELVIQYELKFDDTLACGGAYIKLLRETPDLQLSTFNNDSPYTIMFGPDKCGGDSKVHFILQHQNPITKKWEEKHFQNTPTVIVDQKTHLYTLVLRADNTFEIFIDRVSTRKGHLLKDMSPSINPPETIDDPMDTKPSTWIDDAKIVDPNAVKPEDWDETQPRMIPDTDSVKPADWDESAPKEVPDPVAIKPDDWDDDEDGEWEAPMIPNPACETHGCGPWKVPMVKNPLYKGKWTPPTIDNPEYKGPWSPRKISNPDYYNDETPAKTLAPMSALAIEIWTINHGILYDNFLISHSLDEAMNFSKQTYVKKAEAEKKKEKQIKKELNKNKKLPSTVPEKIIYFVENFLEGLNDFATEQPYALMTAGVVLLLSLVSLLLPIGNRKQSRSTPVKEEEEDMDNTAAAAPTTTLAATQNHNITNDNNELQDDGDSNSAQNDDTDDK